MKKTWNKVQIILCKKRIVKMTTKLSPQIQTQCKILKINVYIFTDTTWKIKKIDRKEIEYKYN